MTEFIGVSNVSALLFASVLDCLNNDSIEIWLTDDAVLPQDVVSDVFQLRHNSNSRVRAPFNEIRLAFHRLTSFSLLSRTNETGQPRPAMIFVSVPSPLWLHSGCSSVCM